MNPLFPTHTHALDLQTLPYIEHYGSNLGYILTVTCQNCDIIPRTAVNTTVVGDWRTDRLTYTTFRVGAMVYEMETYKEFKVIVFSKNIDTCLVISITCDSP